MTGVPMGKKLMQNLRVIMAASRPLGWLIAPIIFFGSMFYVNASFTPLSILQGILLSIPFNLFIFGFNDMHDYESDRINKRKTSIYGVPLRPEHHNMVRNAALASASLLVLSSLITFNPFNIIAMLLLVAFSYLYSAPPFRLKERPPFDSISNGLGVFLVGCLGVSFGGSFFDIPARAYLAAICVMGIHAFSTIMDFRPDSRAGQKTFSTVFGKRAAALFAFATTAFALIFAGIRSPVINAYIAFCSALFFAVVLKPDEVFAATLFKAVFFGFFIAAGLALALGLV